MRIIGGQAKGTRLSAFKGKQIRPTLDGVKESLFNQIQPYLEGVHFLDWFAGTGNIGLEAWSRGASTVILVEHNPQALRTISANLKKCKTDERIQVIRCDAFQAITRLEKQQVQFDMVYIDPPFELNLHDTCLESLVESPILKETTLAIVEHHHKTTLKKNYGKMVLSRERRLGDTRLSFFGARPLFT